jgi:glycosyltransferase involved in cell wall biosynthesis
MSVNQEVGRIRIHHIHKLPTPYTDFFFQALQDNPNIDLHVYHLWRGSWRRPWKSELGLGYNNTFMKPIWGIDWRLLKIAWCDVDSFFMVGDWAHLPTVAVILARYLRRAPVAIWTDTPQEDVKRPLVKKWLRRKFIKWLLPKVDIVFGTGGKAKRLLQEMGANPGQIVDLPVFVDLGRPILAGREKDIQNKAQRLRETLQCWPEGMVFSMIGTLVHRKGMDIGLRAFARCCQGNPKPLGLLIAGEGPERQNLQVLATSLGLGNSIFFLGWQEPEGVEAVYLASDIVLHPARSDPFPGVILEAMSWSRVVIGSDVCGNVEDRIIPGVNGFAFPSGDVDELARIMLDLVDHPEKLPEMGARARKTAEAWPVQRGVAIVLEQAAKILTAKRNKCGF